MKIQGFVAGLGIAGKLALGAGVAGAATPGARAGGGAAATTGAGAAGVLPGPVQHAFAKAVHTVTPFEAPGEHDGPAPDDGGAAAGDTTTTTTEPDEVTTPTTGAHEGDANNNGGDHNNDNGDKNGNGDGNGTVVTPTTQHHESDGNNNGEQHDSTPPTTEHHDGDGEHHGGGGTTPTTEHHDGDNNNPESLELHCTSGHEPNHVSCSWSASSSPDHHKYALLRVDGEHGRVVYQSEDGLAYDDTNVSPDHEYRYRVISLRANGSVDSHSPMVHITWGG